MEQGQTVFEECRKRREQLGVRTQLDGVLGRANLVVRALARLYGPVEGWGTSVFVRAEHDALSDVHDRKSQIATHLGPHDASLALSPLERAHDAPPAGLRLSHQLASRLVLLRGARLGEKRVDEDVGEDARMREGNDGVVLRV